MKRTSILMVAGIAIASVSCGAYVKPYVHTSCAAQSTCAVQNIAHTLDAYIIQAKGKQQTTPDTHEAEEPARDPANRFLQWGYAFAKLVMVIR